MTVTQHPATPEQVQDKQSQQKQTQLLRAAETAQTMQPTQAQDTEGQKHTNPEARVKPKRRQHRHHRRERCSAPTEAENRTKQELISLQHGKKEQRNY